MIFSSPIFSSAGNNQRRQKGVLFSIAAHAAIIGVAFLFTLHYNRVRPVYRESRCCSAALYWTGVVGADTPKDKPAARTKQPRPSHRSAPETTSNASPITLTKAPQSVPGLAATQQQSTIGTGAGTQDGEPAFPVFFPSPDVSDRSLLPPAERKIIVEVNVSALGDVTDEKLVQGLGNNLDQIVMSTVKSWRFHPATLNGTAIGSVEELVFPFNRDYPSDDNPTSNG
jgi:TonB family protein